MIKLLKVMMKMKMMQIVRPLVQRHPSGRVEWDLIHLSPQMTPGTAGHKQEVPTVPTVPLVVMRRNTQEVKQDTPQEAGDQQEAGLQYLSYLTAIN